MWVRFEHPRNKKRSYLIIVRGRKEVEDMDEGGKVYIDSLQHISKCCTLTQDFQFTSFLFTINNEKVIMLV